MSSTYWDHKKQAAYTIKEKGSIVHYHSIYVILTPVKGGIDQKFTEGFFKKLLSEGSLEKVNYDQIIMLEKGIKKFGIE